MIIADFFNDVPDIIRERASSVSPYPDDATLRRSLGEMLKLGYTERMQS